VPSGVAFVASGASASAEASADRRSLYFLVDRAHGDYQAATALVVTATVRPEVQRVLDKLSDVPVDIAPRFTSAASLER
jgi:hypothetical protein